MVEDVIDILLKVISAPETNPLPTPGLKLQPLGAVRIRVAFVCSFAMSFVELEAITIFPSVVHAGLMALAALSAEIFVPPVAAVTETAASAEIGDKKAAAKTTAVKPMIFNKLSILNILDNFLIKINYYF